MQKSILSGVPIRGPPAKKKCQKKLINIQTASKKIFFLVKKLINIQSYNFKSNPIQIQSIQIHIRSILKPTSREHHINFSLHFNKQTSIHAADETVDHRPANCYRHPADCYRRSAAVLVVVSGVGEGGLSWICALDHRLPPDQPPAPRAPPPTPEPATRARNYCRRLDLWAVPGATATHNPSRHPCPKVSPAESMAYN